MEGLFRKQWISWRLCVPRQLPDNTVFFLCFVLQKFAQNEKLLNMKRKKEKRDVAITVRLPASTVASLKILSSDKKNSQSGIIEEAIRVLSKKSKTMKDRDEANF